MAEIISGKPYTEQDGIRTFNVQAPDSEYVWHKDNADREVEILEGEGWQLQIEDCLPMLLNDVKKEDFLKKLNPVYETIKETMPWIQYSFNK